MLEDTPPELVIRVIQTEMEKHIAQKNMHISQKKQYISESKEQRFRAECAEEELAARKLDILFLKGTLGTRTIIGTFC